MIKEYLCHLPKGAAFLPEVDHHTAATVLCFLDGLFDTKDQVWAARADIRPEHVAAVALLHVNIATPDIPESLTSSWIRSDNRAFSSDILAGSPKQYTVKPPRLCH